jgi:hypothetical protein
VRNSEKSGCTEALALRQVGLGQIPRSPLVELCEVVGIELHGPCVRIDLRCLVLRIWIRTASRGRRNRDNSPAVRALACYGAIDQWDLQSTAAGTWKPKVAIALSTKYLRCCAA